VIEVPLCVDLDGTVLLTDSTWQFFLQALQRKPFSMLSFSPDLLFNRGRFKVKLTDLLEPQIDWEFDDKVLAYLKEEKKKGRQIYLATGCHTDFAKKIVGHLELFDKVYGSSDGVNFVSSKKAAKLVEEYGEKGFDYIGNSSQDLAVWSRARYGLVANAGQKLIEKAKKGGNIIKVF